MFARGFLRGRIVRRGLGFIGALLAFLGGLLVLVASFPGGRVAVSADFAVRVILALGALFGAWWIHNGGKALLFPRIRLTTAGLLTGAVGFLMLVMGLGMEGVLVLGGGIVALVATIL